MDKATTYENIKSCSQHSNAYISESPPENRRVNLPLLLYPCPRQYWQDGKPSYWLYFEGTNSALPHTFSFSEASKIRQSCQGTREEAMDFLESEGLLDDGLKVIHFELAGVE